MLPGTLTSALRPGRYWLTADAKGLTVAGQSLEIGPGIRTPPAFGIVEHGDYTSSFPTTKLFDTSERVAAHLGRTLKLGTNMFVDRLGHGGAGGLDAMGGKNEDPALAERLKKDPLAVAPEKAQFENSVHQSIAAYGANGIEQRAILLYMDAGLPVGTGFDARKPEEYVRDITRVSKDLADYPALRGWSWAANWWIGKLGAAAATSPEQKKAYEAAVKRARETGAWDPVLEQVSDAVLHHAVAAERQFNATLQKVAPGQVERDDRPLSRRRRDSADHVPQRRRSRFAISIGANPAAASHPAQCRLLQAARQTGLGASRIVERRGDRRHDRSDAHANGDARGGWRRLVWPGAKLGHAAERSAGHRHGSGFDFPQCE